MTYEEVYNMIAATDAKESDVTIISKASGKKYKQNIYVSSANRLKIRGVNSGIAGYNITNEMAGHWDSIRLVRKRVKKQ